MPSYSKFVFTFALLTAVLALPTPQLAGEGQALDAVFTDTDNAVGYGVKNAEDNTAATLSSLKGPARRQLAGEGQAADALFTDTDNGIGFGIKNAEDNVAATITSVKGGSGSTAGGAAPPPPPPPPKERRQLDKISNGFQDVSNAAGTGSSTTAATQALDNVDGALTSGAANAGATVGETEESSLESIGSAVPKTKRQLDKVSNGFQDVSNAAGTGSSTTAVTQALDNVDGALTGGAANAGATVGETEESTLEGIGSAVPKL